MNTSYNSSFTFMQEKMKVPFYFEKRTLYINVPLNFFLSSETSFIIFQLQCEKLQYSKYI